MNSILKHFWNWLLFSGTLFFAAGAVIDAGAMDAGGEGDQGDSLQSSNGGTDVSDSDNTGSHETRGDGEDADLGTNADKPGDGRTLPKNVQGALKTFKEAHPELAKEIDELRKGYFDSRGHREHFASPAEARQAKAALDLVGGSQGIAELQSKVTAIEMVDASFEQGDPQVLDDIASDYPEGFKKLIGPAIEKLQALDPQSYAKTLQPHTFAAMEAAGLGPVLDAIGQAIAGNDVARAKDLIGKSLAWYQGQKQQAGAVKQNTTDPERVKFETERTKFNSEKESSFRNDIGRETSSHQRSEVDKALAPYLKTKSLTAEERADITTGINGKVNALLKADTTYQAQMKAMLAAKTRDPEKIKQYVKAAVSEAARKAVQSRYGKTAPPQKVTAAAVDPAKKTPVANPAQSAPIKVAAKPKTSDIVKDRGWDLNWMKSKALMATGPMKGKWVTW
jgi:hypothetical protein